VDSLNPNIRDSNSPLKALSHGVLAKYGDYSPDVVAGDIADLFLGLANEVIVDWNMHPYLESASAVPFYVSVDDAREIPDIVMANGLHAKYCEQQASEKYPAAQASYYRYLNLMAYQVKTGGKNPALRFKERK
jgi:hypothetical protein